MIKKLKEYIKFNGVGRCNGFTFIFKYEIWNKDENPLELRIFLLWWEFDFLIKNKHPYDYFKKNS